MISWDEAHDTDSAIEFLRSFTLSEGYQSEAPSQQMKQYLASIHISETIEDPSPVDSALPQIAIVNSGQLNMPFHTKTS
jgi:hypothetical protein